MTTWEEYKEKALQDPELKREYDALEGWYQAELARQEALTAPRRKNAAAHPRRRLRPALHSPSLLYRRRKNGIKKDRP